jgi:lactate dehydrogenase-like 2-hydroxyacid dehydrogenase
MPPPRLREAVRDAEGVLTFLTDRIDADLLDESKIRVVSQVAVGVDNIDVSGCTERGIPVGHTPEVLTETTADTAWALLSAAVRRIPEGRDHVASGSWGPWRPDLLLGGDLHGTVLGIVGMGRIGAAVARRAAGFDMRVVYTANHRKPHLEASLRMSYRVLDDLLAESDHVVLAVPLTAVTVGLIDASALDRMKPSATLVNVSRGPIVETAALVDALETGSIRSAALDVTDPEPLPKDHPLVSLPNCLVVPHIGSASVRTRERMASLAVENLTAGLSGRPMPRCVNSEVYGANVDLPS